MTDRPGSMGARRIAWDAGAARRWALGALLVAGAALGGSGPGGCACTEVQPDPPKPPPPLRAPSNGADSGPLGSREGAGAVELVALAHQDYWLARFGARMDPEVRASYLSTERERRFEKFGPYLLELEQREALLEPFRASLEPAATQAYWRLDGIEESRHWLAERFGEP